MGDTAGYSGIQRDTAGSDTAGYSGIQRDIICGGFSGIQRDDAGYSIQRDAAGRSGIL
jgi:hypothetical protein